MSIEKNDNAILKEIIRLSDRKDLATYYDSIVDKIKSKLENNFGYRPHGEEGYFIEIKNIRSLINRSLDVNENAYLDYILEIKNRILLLINSKFEINTELFFDYALETIKEYFYHEYHVNDPVINSLIEVYTKYTDILKEKAYYNYYNYYNNEQGSSTNSKVINKSNDYNKLNERINKIENISTKESNDYNAIIKSINQLKKLHNTKNLELLTSEIESTKTKIDELYKDTEETSKKISEDYTTFTKQWVVKDLKTKADNLETQREFYAQWYTWMIIIDIAVVIGCVALNMWGLPKLFNAETLSFWQHFSAGVLLTAPLLTIILWLTRYFNRRVHECVHLKEDYENKYLTMLVFDGFKDKISAYGDKAIYEYIMKVISRITENPTNCLSRHKSDMIPATEVSEIIKSILPVQYNSKTDEPKTK